MQPYADLKLSYKKKMYKSAYWKKLLAQTNAFKDKILSAYLTDGFSVLREKFHLSQTFFSELKRIMDFIAYKRIIRHIPRYISNSFISDRNF